MAKTRVRRIWLIAAGFGAMAGAGGIYRFWFHAPSAADPASTALRVTGRDPGYVDARVCAGCHRNIWDTYRRTGMGHSFAAAGAETALEDYSKNNSYYHRASDRHYLMYRRDGKLYQRRHQTGPSGNEINVIEKEVHFVIGSGNHARTYLHRRTDGRLVELPVGWYAEKGGFWAMNPGYDRPDHDDFRREITYQCMFCHNAYPAIKEGDDASGAPPVFPGSLPQGI